MGATRLQFVTIGAVLLGCAPPPALIVLEGQSVQVSEFTQHLKRLEARDGEPLALEVRRAVLDQFVRERLLLLEARRRGLVEADADDTVTRQAVRQLVETELRARAAVSDEEVARRYAEHAESWRTPERRVVRQILSPNLNEARDVRRRLERDPKGFEFLARSRSRGPEAEQGGLMGTFSPGQLPGELEGAVFTLRVGQISPIVESPYGFHVLRLDALEPARERSLAEAQEEVRAQLLSERSEQALDAFLRELRSRAKVNDEAANPVLSAR